MFVEFCLPVFNEEYILEENVVRLLRFCRTQRFPFKWRIVILLNGCADRSSEITLHLSGKYAEIEGFYLKESGKGRALKTYCREAQSDLIFYMDIDLAVSLSHIPEFIAYMDAGGRDLVIGSRLLADSRVERSFYRSISSVLYGYLAKAILKDNIRDRQCGFKIIKTRVFKHVLKEVKDDHWFFDTELIFRCGRYGYKVMEVPISWREDRYDLRRSKLRLGRNGVHFLAELRRLKREAKKGDKLTKK